jgi:hypothetical protein
MKFSEIAESLDLSVDNVKHIYKRGMEKIRKEGNAESFVRVVHAHEMRGYSDVHIDCISLECRPEKWIFMRSYQPENLEETLQRLEEIVGASGTGMVRRGAA